MAPGDSHVTASVTVRRDGPLQFVSSSASVIYMYVHIYTYIHICTYTSVCGVMCVYVHTCSRVVEIQESSDLVLTMKGTH